MSTNCDRPWRTGKLRDELWRARQRRGLTQEQAAILLGVTHNTVARWERGEHEPSGANREKLLAWIAEAEDE